MRGLDADDGLESDADGAQIDACAIAFDHSGFLELADTLAHRRLGEADALADRSQALSCVVLQGLEDPEVFFVQLHGDG